MRDEICGFQPSDDGVLLNTRSDKDERELEVCRISVRALM